MKYEKANDLKELAEKIVKKMNWNHIDLNNVGFLRSFGSSTKRTIARCHGLGKAMQIAMERKSFYVIEVISERFDKLNEEDKEKVLIHELMHIPKSFGGGFIHHNKVNEKSVEENHKKFKYKGYLDNFS
ncbi:MAG: putative metallopeptidase [Candidatus Pacearchaeota archaeon]